MLGAAVREGAKRSIGGATLLSWPALLALLLVLLAIGVGVWMWSNWGKPDVEPVKPGPAMLKPHPAPSTPKEAKPARPATELLGILDYAMNEKTTSVVLDRRFGQDQKLWPRWRNLDRGSMIRIDDEELETADDADVRRSVDRGANGTGPQPHAKGAKVYLVQGK
jgi:hypothetical protein